MKSYMYAGKPLSISRYADMPNTMRPGNKYAPFIQELLDSIEPWKFDEDPIETMEFDEQILPMAVPIDNNPITWGVHRGHKARRPGLSPFVYRRVPRELMGAITVELKGSPDDPLLIRAYGGEYTPPLPWMSSAGDAEGGKQECLNYWRSHAYLLTAPSLIREDSNTAKAPSWFTS